MNKALSAYYVLFAPTACENEDNLSPQNFPESLNASLTVSDGLITAEFIEEGCNKTSIFNPYPFLFKSDSFVIALKQECPSIALTGYSAMTAG